MKTTDGAGLALNNTSGPRYGGQYHDAGTDQIYLRNRYLDSKTGRFNSPDPLGGVDGPNLYSYAKGNPIGNWDPMGTKVRVNENQFDEGGWLSSDWRYGISEDLTFFQRELLSEMIKSEKTWVFTTWNEMRINIQSFEKEYVKEVSFVGGKAVTSATLLGRQASTAARSALADQVAASQVQQPTNPTISMDPLHKPHSEDGNLVDATLDAVDTYQAKGVNSFSAGAVAIYDYLPFAGTIVKGGIEGASGNSLSANDLGRELGFNERGFKLSAAAFEAILLSGMKGGPFASTTKAAATTTAAPSTRRLIVGAHGDLSSALPPGVQSNHLIQNAVVKGIIPEAEGVAVGLVGDAFTGFRTPHFNFHTALEGFWNKYRPGGRLVGSSPTWAEYDVALLRALEAADLSRAEASRLTRLARTQRLLYGLEDSAAVPRIPRAIYSGKQ